MTMSDDSEDIRELQDALARAEMEIAKLQKSMRTLSEATLKTVTALKDLYKELDERVDMVGGIVVDMYEEKEGPLLVPVDADSPERA